MLPCKGDTRLRIHMFVAVESACNAIDNAIQDRPRTAAVLDFYTLCICTWHRYCLSPTQNASSIINAFSPKGSRFIYLFRSQLQARIPFRSAQQAFSRRCVIQFWPMCVDF